MDGAAPRRDFVRYAGRTWTFDLVVTLAPGDTEGLQADGMVVSMSARAFREVPGTEYFLATSFAAEPASRIEILSPTKATITIEKEDTRLIPTRRVYYQIVGWNQKTGRADTPYAEGVIDVRPWADQLPLATFVGAVAADFGVAFDFAAAVTPAVDPPKTIFGSALKGEFYADIGYNTSTHAWDDQSGNGNHMTALGTPTIVPSALNGYPAVSYSGDSNYHRRASGVVGLPIGTKVTAIFVLKRNNATLPRGYFTLSEGVLATYVQVGAGALSSADWNQSKQSLPSVVSNTDLRTDRFNIIEHGGQLGSFLNGRRLGGERPEYTGIAVAGTSWRVGNEALVGKGSNASYVSAHVIAGTITQAQRDAFNRWIDSKYGLTATSRSKWLACLGQSNGESMQTNAWTAANATYIRPRNSQLYAGAVSGSALLAGAAHWGPADPQGWRAAAAADYLAAGEIVESVIHWDQGEADAPGSSAYTDAVIEFIANMDYRCGFVATQKVSDADINATVGPLWLIPRIHVDSFRASMRPYQEAVGARVPNRCVVYSIDDLSLDGNPSEHLDIPSQQAKWIRTLQQADAYFGSTDWAG